MRRWTAPSGALKGRAKRPACWLKQENMSIMKNLALKGKRNLKQLENGDFTNKNSLFMCN